MLKILYGKRGSGKTTKMISMANAAVESNIGDVVFIDDDKRCILDLHHNIRYINSSEYSVITPSHIVGFLCGIMAQDYDIKQIYLDGFPQLIGKDDASLMEEMVSELKRVADKFNIDIIISISGPEGSMPEFVREFTA